ncbi:hypothetical protein [Celeribacter arenosi]|uniref:Uncharacterized protein n=1 Tax=Celeribacter arenosi TaxID=792649 RepID=A0ABP7KC96_9RHOB
MKSALELLLRAAFSLLVIAPLPLGATQNDTRNYWAPYLELLMTNYVSLWAHDPVIIESLRAANRDHIITTRAQIGDLDHAWTTGQAEDLVAAILQNPASEFLRKQFPSYDGALTEAILTDENGITIAMSQKTTDYWQGDEVKHAHTVPVGPRAIYVGEMEIDTSTGAYQGQVSMTITDPDTGKPIGALTLGMVPELL